jgi:hypothetical protein
MQMTKAEWIELGITLTVMLGVQLYAIFMFIWLSK